jgi:hypothetical protein
MRSGSGQYADIAEYVHKETDAEAVVIIIINGNKGNGYEIRSHPDHQARIPLLLRLTADDLERSE